MDDKNENICGEQDGEEIKLSREKGKERKTERRRKARDNETENGGKRRENIMSLYGGKVMEGELR